MSCRTMTKKDIQNLYGNSVDNKNNLKIERKSYTNRGGEIVPHEKIIYEKLEEDCYRELLYRWHSLDSKWYPSKITSFFDGEKTQDIGLVKLTKNNIDRYFELCVKYSGFKYV